MPPLRAIFLAEGLLVEASSRASKKFWALYDRLPERVQKQADKTYAAWIKDPLARIDQPPLHFKPLERTQNVWSIRVGGDYRAVAKRTSPSSWEWIWIGTHNDYDKIIARL